jgi:hypothetical protein
MDVEGNGGLISRYYPGICLKGLRNSTKNRKIIMSPPSQLARSCFRVVVDVFDLRTDASDFYCVSESNSMRYT